MQKLPPQSNSRIESKEVRRLTPADYSKAEIRKPYDCSVKDREARDRQMEKYLKYLMKLCTLTHQAASASQNPEDE